MGSHSIPTCHPESGHIVEPRKVTQALWALMAAPTIEP